MAEEDKRPEPIKKEETKEIALVWQSAENISTVYVNQVLISHTGPEFYLIFGEVVTPAINGNASGDLPNSMEVKPLVKIAVTPSMMILMAKVIGENVSRFENRINELVEKNK